MSDVEHILHEPSDEDFSEEMGLTGIPQRIHCTATEDSGGSELDELDIIAIENFLDTLSEIAISIATRGTLQGQEKANDRSSH